MKQFQVLFAISILFTAGIEAFQASTSQPKLFLADNLSGLLPQRGIALHAAEGSPEDSDIVGKRITVTGDVHGGYYRSCVANEVRNMKVTTSYQQKPRNSNLISFSAVTPYLPGR